MVNVPTNNIIRQLEPIDLTNDQVIEDYRIAYLSRQASLLARREVLNGRAKFGILGDGKEVAQLAMARAFQHGDFRSGYYRDQTFMLAVGELSLQQYFAQLYAHADVDAEPNAAGRQMNSHYATRFLNEDGSWKDQTKMNNVSADISCTAGQMPRLVGLAYASSLYRDLEELQHFTQFSRNGQEIAFGTIGNASCAEGPFWEALNAIGVLQAPAIIGIWDDDYGISVPNKYQITKSLTELLSGFARSDDADKGYELYTVRGWDYAALVTAYQDAEALAREQHIPSLIHVIEMTQPQGHSTSGSHERYKSAERLQWEADHDCLMKMREWLIATEISTDEALTALESTWKTVVYAAKDAAWEAYIRPILQDAQAVADMLDRLASRSKAAHELQAIRAKLLSSRRPVNQDNIEAVYAAIFAVRDEQISMKQELIAWRDRKQQAYKRLYNSHLYSESAESPRNVIYNPPTYAPDADAVNGFEVLQAAFDAILERDSRVIAFGEDVGKIGGVNQSFAGMQAKYGELRVTDTGIRECTIVGQGIGLAMRGLRPIAEIQYLDYLLYALQVMSDDLATVHWRTRGGQKAPVIIRTRGHRLEGIWHAGSPMAGIVNLVQGINVLVPRDMVRAAGFYNTLLKGDEPGLIIEVLSGYRLKEVMPDNISEITIPLGVPEVLREGSDVTIVTYGACCRIALESAEKLHTVGIDVEVIDVQSLLPFDRHHRIVESLKKTNRILFFDEDVPGGMSAYMMQHVLEVQGGYNWLDAEPITLTAAPHRPSYGSDGGYFSKPQANDVFTAIYEMMNESAPADYPFFYK